MNLLGQPNQGGWDQDRAHTHIRRHLTQVRKKHTQAGRKPTKVGRGGLYPEFEPWTARCEPPPLTIAFELSVVWRV